MSALEPLEVLYDVGPLPAAGLPGELARIHGGSFWLDADCVYANFVATLDGVVAIPSRPRSNDVVADDSVADRFVMGLLRAFAEAVLIGAGVLGASPRGTWRPEKVYPPAAAEYRELRHQLGLAASPEVAVLTGSGSIDPEHPLLETGALVLTSDPGADTLRGRLPSASTIVALGSSVTIDPRAVIGALRERGHERILCEAGPHTFGELVGAGLVDELFLTSSPLLVGDAGPGSRLRLVEKRDLAHPPTRLRLIGVRRHGSHLFQRFELGG